jgi:hypothetical protein
MKAYICDVCGAHAEPDTYDLHPVGWYSVTKRATAWQNKHVCSVDCLERYVASERPPIELQPPAPPTPDDSNWREAATALVQEREDEAHG